jgi:hypothetical protein
VSVRGTTLATQTDASGKYELKNVLPGDQVVRFSKSGFASVVVTDVRVLPGQTTTVNGNPRPEFYEMEEYEVTAEEFTQQTEKIFFERQQSSSLMDAVGSDQFSKLGAGDAGQIVARITGVSVVGGKYAVVRGLSDRYTRTLRNGVEVPSADPYRLSPQLDLFPSAMIDPLFGHNLGVFGGLNYKRELRAIDEAIVNRYSPCPPDWASSSAATSTPTTAPTSISATSCGKGRKWVLTSCWLTARMRRRDMTRLALWRAARTRWSNGSFITLTARF